MHQAIDIGEKTGGKMMKYNEPRKKHKRESREENNLVKITGWIMVA